MKKKIIIFNLICVSFVAFLPAQTSIGVYQDCSKNGINEDFTKSGTTNGHEWVDLGLSVYWATSSLDGEYAWGETTTKSQYTWETYSMSGSTWEHMYKYSDWDGKIQLEASDDVATQKWGNGWHIPTKTEWDELMACQHTNNGGKYSFTNNDITLSINSVDHWSSTRNNTYDYMAYHFRAVTNNITVYSRYHEMMIRPVCVKSSVEKYTIIVMSSNCIEYNTYKFNKSAVTQISAVPNTGYHFVKWNDGNTSNPRTITVTENAMYTAEFALDTCKITTSATNGMVTGAGTYKYNTNVTLTATPNEHYHFVKWSDGNTSNPRTVTVTKDSTFTAVFALDQFTITATGEHGTVTGIGTYNYGATATLTATNSDCYTFQKWSDGNTDNPRSVVVTQDSTFIAEFAKQIDSTQIKDVSVFGDCSKNGYKKDFSHIATVNSSSGRTSCEWVQLWENGPKWATFNVGSTITNYANLTIGEDPISFSNYTKQAPYYNTANTGGLYPWNNPNVNGRKTTWKSTTGISDVATAIWGSNWKTPTSKQLDTLLLESYGKTTWTWCDGNTTQYVVGCTLKGYKVSGVGDYAQFSIFLPAAGYYNKSSGKIADASSYGKYWSGSVSYSGSAYDFLYFYAGYRVNASIRENGNSVRAVLANNVEDDIVILTLKASDCETDNIITCVKDQPLRIIAANSECSKFVRWSDGNTDNTRVVSINDNCAYTAIFEKINYTITLDADAEKGEVVEEK